MTKQEKLREGAMMLARKTVGQSVDEATLQQVAEKIFRSLPAQVRQAA